MAGKRGRGRKDTGGGPSANSTVRSVGDGTYADNVLSAQVGKYHRDENTRKKKELEYARNALRKPIPEYRFFSNPDKEDHVIPEEGDVQIGHPSRISIVGPPGCGKRTALLNIIENLPVLIDTVTFVHATHKSEELNIFKSNMSLDSNSRPKKKRAFADSQGGTSRPGVSRSGPVVYHDPSNPLLEEFEEEEDEDAYDVQIYEWDMGQNEYADSPYPYVGLPPLSRFQKKDEDGKNLHNLLVLDEPPFKLNTKDTQDLLRLFGYVSTHHNTTIFIVTQYITALPPAIRSALTHMIFFPTLMDPHATQYTSQLMKIDMEKLYRRVCRTKYDSIMFDLTGIGPAMRRNVYEPIENMEVQRPMKTRMAMNDEVNIACVRRKLCQGGGQPLNHSKGSKMQKDKEVKRNQKNSGSTVKPRN